MFSFVFCRKSKTLNNNFEIFWPLGTHNEKICAEISTGNTPKLIRPICQLFGIFKKKSSSHVHCPCTWQNFRCEKVCCVPPKVSSVLGTFGRHDVHHLIANFFMFKIGKNLQVAKIFSSIPLLMWEDARKKSEKSLDEETIECVFGNRIFGWIWLDFFVRRLRLWFWSAAKIENKKVFYFFPMNRRRVMLSELDDCYHWKWAKLVLTRHTKACDC